MDNRVKFYCWLISLLEHNRLTYDEIADAWANSGANAGGEELSLRTFHRYRNAIESQFGIIVECSSKSDGYRYSIRKDTKERDKVTEWMLSSLRLASLGEVVQYHNKVMLDTPPYNSEYLDDILCAIDKHYLLKFHYTTAYGVKTEMELLPAFVRLYKQRWYVIGMKNNASAADEKSLVRCLPFDRMASLEVVCKKYPLPAGMDSFLTPENYYKHCYGIMRMEAEAPETVRIRAFYPEYNYIEELPLHESQQRVAEAEDGRYREYTLTVRPCRDFLQELLWHGRGIVVLEPESLRRKMTDILHDMTRSYETGECCNGE